MPVRNTADKPTIQADRLAYAVNNNKIVAQCLHFGKSDRHFEIRVYSPLMFARDTPLSFREYVTEKFQQIKNHRNRWVRTSVGIFLVLGGIFGALPILGFWMLPLGLILLSVDFPWAKRLLVNIKLFFRRIRNRFRRRAPPREINSNQP